MKRRNMVATTRRRLKIPRTREVEMWRATVAMRFSTKRQCLGAKKRLYDDAIRCWTLGFCLPVRCPFLFFVRFHPYPSIGHRTKKGVCNLTRLFFFLLLLSLFGHDSPRHSQVLDSSSFDYIVTLCRNSAPQTGNYFTRPSLVPPRCATS